MQEQEPVTPWVTWYGDDFTGSAAVMEALAFAGVVVLTMLAAMTFDPRLLWDDSLQRRDMHK